MERVRFMSLFAGRSTILLTLKMYSELMAISTRGCSRGLIQYTDQAERCGEPFKAMSEGGQGCGDPNVSEGYCVAVRCFTKTVTLLFIDMIRKAGGSYIFAYSSYLFFL